MYLEIERSLRFWRKDFVGIREVFWEIKIGRYEDKEVIWVDYEKNWEIGCYR